MTPAEHLVRAIELLESRVLARETPVFTNDMKVMKEALEHLKKTAAWKGLCSCWPVHEPIAYAYLQPLDDGGCWLHGSEPHSYSNRLDGHPQDPRAK